MSLMSDRRAIYNRRTPVRTRIIPQSQRQTGMMPSRRPDFLSQMSRSRALYSSISARSRAQFSSRGTVRIPTRPGVTIPTRPTFTMPSRPTFNLAAIIPTATASPGGGLPTPSVTGGGLGLGEIGGDIQAFGGNILDQFKALIPTAIKIIAAVVIIKIVLWLVKGRRR